jgi:pyruvate kinase
LLDEMNSSASTFLEAMRLARQQGLLVNGDLVVQTAGSASGVSGSTDLLKVALVNSES